MGFNFEWGREAKDVVWVTIGTRVIRREKWRYVMLCYVWLNRVELPLVEAVVDRVNISEGARAVLKCRIKSSSTDTDIAVRWFHNANPVNTAHHFATQHSLCLQLIFSFFVARIYRVAQNQNVSDCS